LAGLRNPLGLLNHLDHVAPCQRQIPEGVSQMARPVVDVSGLECLLLVVPFAAVLLQRCKPLILTARMENRLLERQSSCVDAIQKGCHRHKLRPKVQRFHGLDTGSARAPLLDLGVMRYEVDARHIGLGVNDLGIVVDASARGRVAIEDPRPGR
jgi:hypothetical protein